MKSENYDIIIAGAGIAGLYAALCLDSGFRILLLSKREIFVCNSAMAQGGVAAVIDKDGDNFELHIKDTLTAGGNKNYLPNLWVLVEKAPLEIENLLRLGVGFDKNPDGSLDLALEGGHSRNRIAHYKDSTGYAIVSALAEKVKSLPNVTLLENAHLLDLTASRRGQKASRRGQKASRRGQNSFDSVGGVGKFTALVYHNNSYEYYNTKTCLLATGGIGRVYDFTTNGSTSTGDGIYFAGKLGAKIKDLSCIQFHPTAFADKTSRECFLISEAVRGEGAYLLNCKKERFMQKYEPKRMELSPRDVVSKCILAEQKETGSDEFFLDISHVDSDYIKERFPMIYSRVLGFGYDITKEPVPIYPCQHYLMGGIEVDDFGNTSVDGLYASGECSTTGVHGANRLAGNSLLEALVFSRRVAEDINERRAKFYEPDDIDNIDKCGNSANNAEEVSKPKSAKPDGLRREIRKIMQTAYFIEPDYNEVAKGLSRIREIRGDLESENYALTPELAETRSLAGVAEVILSELTNN